MALTPEQRTKLTIAFRPHSPIEDPSSFFGRQEELERVKDGIFEPGQQIIIFGERGAGKTSLANVATSGLERIQVFCEENANFAILAKHIVLEYQKLKPALVNYDAQRDRIVVGGAVMTMNSLDGNSLRNILPPDAQLCIILDELDRLKDAATIASLGELAKNVSTYQPKITFVFIGVAETAQELLKGHKSNFRNLKDVSLGRMEMGALSEIIANGEKILELTFSDRVKELIIDLSDMLPYYLHLLATNSAKAALLAGRNHVDIEHLNTGAQDAAKDADQTLSESYEHARLSVKSSNIYRYALWALAARAGNSHSISQLLIIANQFATRDGNPLMTVQSLGQAVKTLASAKKGEIITSKSSGFYSFSHPLMKGYIRLVMERL